MKIAFDCLFDVAMWMSDVWMRIASWADDRLTAMESREHVEPPKKPLVETLQEWCARNAHHPTAQLVGGPLDGAKIPLRGSHDHVGIFSDPSTNRCYAYHYFAKNGEYHFQREVGTLGMPKKK